eukprot:scaffold294389_cov14-Tisochrysis_lutea.AAC.1
MKKAGEVSAKVQRNPPEKEVGLVTGAPLEVFKRQVSVLVGGHGWERGEEGTREVGHAHVSPETACTRA